LRTFDDISPALVAIHRASTTDPDAKALSKGTGHRRPPRRPLLHHNGDDSGFECDRAWLLQQPALMFASL